MRAGRVLALTGSHLKRTLREPGFLVVVLMFPVALTVLFGTAFGAAGDGVEYRLAVVDEDASDWSQALTANLSATGILEVGVQGDEATARRALSDGGLDAVLVIPAGFGEACRSYRASPDDGSAWSPATVTLYLDPGSMVSTQALPPLVEQVIERTVYDRSPVVGPIEVGTDSVAPGVRLTTFDHMAPGLVTFAAIFFIMLVGQAFTTDREAGLLRRMATTPATAGELITSHLAANVALAGMQLIIVFGLMAVLGFHFAAAPAGIVAAFLLGLAFSVTTVGLGLVTAAVSRSPGQATGVAFLFIMPMMFLGTFMGEMLTGPAQQLGSVLPAYYMTDGVTSLLLRGAALDSPTVLFDFAVVLLSGAAVMAIGTVLFRRLGRW